MESVGTKSYRQRASDTLSFEAAAPHIVVVCPSCKTSFAVETAAVAALETPRFHCSRCDDIFIMKDAPADMLPLGGVKVQSLAHAGQLRHSTQPRGGGLIRESLIKPSDFSLGSDTQPPKAFIEPNFDAPPEPPLEARSGLSLLSRGIEESPATQETRFEAPVTFTSPVIEQPTSSAPVMRNTSGIEEPTPTQDFVVTPSTAPTQTLSSRQFVLADPPPTLPDHGLKPTRLKEEPSSLSKAVAAAPETIAKARPLPETESYRPTPQPRRSETHGSTAGEQRRFSIRTQSLLSMGAPILGALAVLLGMSYSAQLSPQSVDALMNYITPSALKESAQTSPPSALGVKNLRISFQKTRNREIIPVITGRVVNESGRAFEEVELEAIGFNGRGEIIASSRAPLRSALSNEDVSELSLETVSNYQRALAAKDSSIKAREGVPFTIALLNGRQLDQEMGATDFDPSQVKYFSARIFSIKRPK
ncbi:MAG: hypothetical protein RL518_1896 [Pseudomonadota bacterium]|jgi:predicted Zn finger-like uncharacterized protein